MSRDALEDAERVVMALDALRASVDRLAFVVAVGVRQHSTPEDERAVLFGAFDKVFTDLVPSP